MRLCDRCGQADAVVVVSQLTMDAGNTAGSSGHLCGACAQQEHVSVMGGPLGIGPAGDERFHLLQAHVLQLLARLEATYEVTRSEAFPLSRGVFYSREELRSVSVLPPVLLTPQLPEAAPFGVVFLAPPVLLVRCGRWHEVTFGNAFYREDDSWGSRASEADRFDDLVGKVVDGLFGEAVRLPLVGRARLSATFGDGTVRAGLNGEGWTRIPRALGRTLIDGGPRAVRWRPWPRRRL
jgi:hypothetical protein